jgi:hypothetical protein
MMIPEVGGIIVVMGSRIAIPAEGPIPGRTPISVLRPVKGLRPEYRDLCENSQETGNAIPASIKTGKSEQTGVPLRQKNTGFRIQGTREKHRNPPGNYRDRSVG